MIQIFASDQSVPTAFKFEFIALYTILEKRNSKFAWKKYKSLHRIA